MSERDELAEIIQDCGEYIPGSHADDYVSPNKAADAILAAGYRKPRIITTAEELDALPVGSVVLDNDGYGEVYQKAARRPAGIKWYETGYAIHWDSLELNLPATVLYSPEPTP